MPETYIMRMSAQGSPIVSKKSKTFRSDEAGVMLPADFKRWRKSLNLSQKEAAAALGLKRRVVQYYERGERDGKEVLIPRTVRLACYALTAGASDYAGPPDQDERGTATPAPAAGTRAKAKA